MVTFFWTGSVYTVHKLLYISSTSSILLLCSFIQSVPGPHFFKKITRKSNHKWTHKRTVWVQFACGSLQGSLRSHVCSHIRAELLRVFAGLKRTRCVNTLTLQGTLNWNPNVCSRFSIAVAVFASENLLQYNVMIKSLWMTFWLGISYKLNNNTMK